MTIDRNKVYTKEDFDKMDRESRTIYPTIKPKWNAEYDMSILESFGMTTAEKNAYVRAAEREAGYDSPEPKPTVEEFNNSNIFGGVL